MKLKTLAVSAIVAGMLIGCGGGSSDSDNTESSSSEVVGTAVDEIIQNGVVELHAGSPAGEILVTTRTDMNGNYKATVKNYTGVVVSVIKCDEQSRMKGFDGADLGKCNLDVPLMTAVEVAKNTTVKAHASPMTTMLVALATRGNNSSKIDTTKLTKAKKTIAYMYGIDPTVLNPATNDIYKKEVLALHQVAQNNHLNMGDLIKALNADAADGIIGDDNSSLVSGIKQQLSNNGIKSSFIMGASSTINAAVIGASSVPYDAIGIARSTFSTVRGQIDSIANENETGTLNKEAQAIENSITKNTFETVGKNVEVMGRLLEVVVDSDLNVSGTFKLDNGNEFDYSLDTDDNKSWSYTLKDSNGDEYKGSIISNIDTRNQDSWENLPDSITATIDGKIPNKNGSTDVKANVKFNKNGSLMTLDINNLYIGTNSDNVAIKNVKVEVGYEDVENDGEKEPKAHYVKLKSITLDTTLDNRFTFDGTITVDYVQNKIIADRYGKNDMFHTEVEEVRFAIECNNSNHDYYDGDKIPTYTLEGKTYTVDYCDNNGNTCYDWNVNAILEGEVDNDEIKKSITVNVDELQCKDGSDVITTGWMSVESYDDVSNSGYIPNMVKFEGKVKDLDTKVELDGTISAKSDQMSTFDVDNENIALPGKVSLAVILKRPNFADTIVNGTYEILNSEGDERLTVSYKEGTTDLVTMKANYDKINGDTLVSGVVEISSINGLRATIPVTKEGDIDYSRNIPVYVGSIKVGNIEERDGLPVVKYMDGTFESFN